MKAFTQGELEAEKKRIEPDVRQLNGVKGMAVGWDEKQSRICVKVLVRHLADLDAEAEVAIERFGREVPLAIEAIGEAQKAR